MGNRENKHFCNLIINGIKILIIFFHRYDWMRTRIKEAMCDLISILFNCDNDLDMGVYIKTLSYHFHASPILWIRIKNKYKNKNIFIYIYQVITTPFIYGSKCNTWGLIRAIKCPFMFCSYSNFFYLWLKSLIWCCFY